MKIIRCTAASLFLTAFLLFPSCNKSADVIPLGNWVHVGDFPGVPRSGAYNFTIGNITYIGGGYFGGFIGGTSVTYVIDGYSYSQDEGFWHDIAPFPGTPRERAVSFALNGKGYVGTGYNRDAANPADAQLKDFWEYDPTADTWTQIADFKGNARYGAVGFADSQYGYVGTGYDGTYYNDFYQYDPSVNEWTKIGNYPGEKVEQATTFTIDGKYYLLSGLNNGTYVLDLWQFDPTADQKWSRQTPLTTDAQYTNFRAAIARYDAVGFSLDGKGYIATGVSGSAQNTIYQYDPAALTWTKMTSFERSPRTQAVAFVVGGRAFLGTGTNAVQGGNGTRFDDIMEFQPTIDYNAND